MARPARGFPGDPPVPQAPRSPRSPPGCPRRGRRPSVTDRPARSPLRVLPVLERVTANVHLDPYLALPALADYAGLSIRTLREYLVHPPLPRDAGAPLPPPLPHYRLGGRIVVRRSEFDRWMAAYRRVGQADVEGIVNSVISDLRRA